MEKIAWFEKFVGQLVLQDKAYTKNENKKIKDNLNRTKHYQTTFYLIFFKCFFFLVEWILMRQSKIQKMKIM